MYVNEWDLNPICKDVSWDSLVKEKGLMMDC